MKPARMYRPLLAAALLALAVLPAAAQADTGPYLDFGDPGHARPTYKIDGRGIPMVVYTQGCPGHQPGPNPCGPRYYAMSVAQVALEDHAHGQLRQALKLGRWLLHRQAADGAWHTRFAWTLGHVDTLERGWISAMTQGQAMSLFVRLHHATRNPVWIRAAARALTPFRKTVAEGGVLRDFQGFRWYEEYPTPRPLYTLNGFMFALVGLHDLAPWSAQAGSLYWGGRRALVKSLPYFTDRPPGLYHLGFWEGGYGKQAVFPASPRYNRIHVMLLDALNALHPSKPLRVARARFESFLP